MTMTAMLAVVGAYLLGGVSAGEILAPRLRSHQLRAHAADLEQKEHVGSLSLLANATETLPESIDEIESTLVSLGQDKAAGKATPGMESFADTIRKMIKVEMLPEISKGHTDAKKKLNAFRLGFTRCKGLRTASTAPIRAMNLVRGSSSSNHKVCRRHENTQYVAKEACKKVVESKRKAMKAACDAFRALHRKPETEADKCHTTVSAEPYHSWLTRNRQFFQEKYNAFIKAENLCRATTVAWRAVKIPCDRRIALYQKTRSSCVVKQRRLETTTCTLGKKMKDTCDKYDTCHDRQAALYRKAKPTLMIQEKDRKGEYRALKRIECLLEGVFGGPTVNTEEIDKCKKLTHSTKWLDLVYPPIPPKQKCAALPVIPGEQAFITLEFSRLSKNTPAVRTPSCILSPAGGILIGVEKYASKKYKNYCSASNGWLSAQNGGSCVVSERNGIPVQVNYKKARYTKFRFMMKMDETSTRNAYKGGGGFAICNNNGIGWRSSSPTISFVDAKKSSEWGYKLTSGWASNPVRQRKPVTCKDLVTNTKVWGKEAKGFDLSKYTGNHMNWMGCMGDGCAPKDFYCTQKRDELIFGSTGTMRAALGKEFPLPTDKPACGSRKNPSGLFNPMDKTRDIDRLCKALGYTRGTILNRKKQNFCPGVSSTSTEWGSTFLAKTSYGTKFRCQGPQAVGLYTSKKFYKRAEPTKGSSVQWSVTMMYDKGQYSLKSLNIGGQDFSAYAGKIAQCSSRSAYAFAPRVVSHPARGKVYIKDFRVYQGNSLRADKMKQVVGQGVGRLEGKALRKKLRAAVRYAYQTFEIHRLQFLNIKNPTWYRMWAEAQRRGGRLMTYAEAKLYINRRKGVLYGNRDYWAAVTNPNEKRAKKSSQGKKDWIQLGSRPHPPKTSHSGKFGYPGWGDHANRHRGGATTSVLLYVTKSRRKYVIMQVKVKTTCIKKGKKTSCNKIVKRKVPVKIAKSALKKAVTLKRPIRALLKRPRPRKIRRPVRRIFRKAKKIFRRFR